MTLTRSTLRVGDLFNRSYSVVHFISKLRWKNFRLSFRHLAMRAVAIPFSSTTIPARSSRSITSLFSIVSRSAAKQQPSRLLPILSQRRYEHGATQDEPEETSAAPAPAAEAEAPNCDMLRKSLPPSTTL